MEAAIVKIIAEYGVIPVVVFLMTVGFFLLRDLKKSLGVMERHLADGQESLKTEIDTVRNDLLQRIQELKERSSRRDRELKKRIGNLEVRVVALENGILRREQLEEITGEIRKEIAALELRQKGERNGTAEQD